MSARTPPVVVAAAPAKVNLVLEVLGRRADGYHELWTWMLALDLEDEVRVRRIDASEARGPAGTTRTSAAIVLTVSGPAATPDVRADDSNLVFRAARAVLERAGGANGVALELVKRIPSQSGLGGASADAAAAVLACERALEFDLGAAERVALLARLGSDCAFFAGAPAGLALCGGRGEELRATPSSVPSWHVVVLVPAVRCPTPAVYAELARRLSPLGAPPRLPPDWLALPAAEARPFLLNRLETAALAVAPELVRWRALLDAIDGAHARLTGSGSAFFALFDERAEADAFGAAVEVRARELGLDLRGRWTARAAGRGAKVLER